MVPVQNMVPVAKIWAAVKKGADGGREEGERNKRVRRLRGITTSATNDDDDHDKDGEGDQDDDDVNDDDEYENDG